MDAWFELIARYSALNLTLMSDKITAIAGLASRFAESFKTTYLAGLWKEDLPNCLLWYVVQSGSSKRLETCVPSWSWASIHGAISRAKGSQSHGGYFLGPAMRRNGHPAPAKIDVKIIGIDCGYEDGSLYVNPQYGIIKVKGRKAKVNFDEQHRVIMETHSLTFKTEHDLVCPDVSDWSEFQAIDDCYLLIICEYEPRYQLECLILRPARGSSRSFQWEKHFRRIGYYMYSRYE
jgi:hypothetical protein